LRVDGIAGPQTRGALGPLGRPLLGRRALRLGVFGWDVSVLQFELTRVGLYRWPIDGYFGPETARALRQFQRRHGLVADGVAGPRTLARIRRGVAPMRAAVPPQTLVVRPGDTLTAIARRLGTTPGVLARENGMVLRDVLLVGTRLRVPRVPEASPDAVRDLLNAWSRRYGVDSSLARALAWMESGYQPNVVSHAGAWGVMQIIPTSWEYVEGVLLGEEVPRTVEGNVRVGVALLHRLLQEFGGDERLALGAWYQGARAVRDHGLFPETRAFVADVLALRSRV
jgi:soluble lytic murein transglycosylase-like protein